MTPGAEDDGNSSTFTLRRVQAMLGLSRTIVAGLIADGFVAPTRGKRNEWRFTFQDLMLLRTAHALQASKIPPRRILRSLARLKATLPQELPLTGLRITAIGADVAVRDRNGQWQSDSGQLLMDFDVAPVAGSVAFLERGKAPAATGDAQASFERGLALEAGADAAGAEAAYLRALALAPDHAAAYLNVGAMWSEAGRYTDLARLSDEAVLHCPDSALIHFNRGVALDHLERLPEAIASYERSLDLDPRLADAHYNLGRLREQLGDKRGALRHFSAYRRLQRSVAARMAQTPEDPLARYWAKRNFAITSEPRGDVDSSGSELSFVIQKHAASRLHYDFRLELDGVLLSWAVPKGPSYDPTDKRIAIHVEDHPLSYGSFEGTIPPRQYGAGTVIVWDRGTWQPTVDPRQGLKDGKLVFTLQGHKMFGLWELVRIAKPGDRQDPWLLFKKRDRYARPRTEYDVVSALPDSVIAKPLKADGGTAGGPAGAVKAPLPATMSPQLATLAGAAPTSGAWSWEIKLDGYRLMARIDGGQVRLITRGGHDWSAKMPGLVKALLGLGLRSAWLDGEIVVLGPSGMPSFNALQNAFDRSRTEGITYFLFDLPYFEGYDLRAVPLVSRRQVLEQLLEDHPGERLRFSADFDADAAAILESARRMGLEGVIAKRKDAVYESRRTETWLKLKNKLRQEFVVAGYTDRSSGEAEVGSLLLAVHDDGDRLVYVGNVGTGWDAATAATLKTRLKTIEVATSPFGTRPLHQHRWGVRDPAAQHWVEPQLVAEVEFSDWTPDDQVRHAKFLGLRMDKDAKTVKRESAVMPDGPALVKAGSSSVGGIKVSHPERVIDASTGVTKLELVRYYESVAEWMLPHLKGRPCSLVRGPTGVGGELFYQKHVEAQIPGIKELDPALWPGHASLLEVPTKKALIASAQMNVIEFHTWNALVRRIDQPDRVVFDLDPGDGERWERVQEAATLVRGFLHELALESWLKTSGGKGLHVVVPLTPRDDWETVRGFAQAVVQHLARVIPQRFVAKSGAANRVGRIFVDYLRNNHGATTAAAFSARARPGLGVSMPLAWDELKALKRSDQWTVRTAREHLSFQSVDPWQDYWGCKQNLKAALKALGAGAAG